MPGMVAFGRRWGIASDDLVFPGIFELFLRVIWYVSLLCLCGFHWYLWLLPSGTITNPGARRSLPALVYLRAMLYIPELVWACLGAIWVSDDSRGCDPATVGSVIAAVVTSWIILLLTGLGVVFVFDPLGNPRSQHGPMEPLGVRDLESSGGTQFLSTARSLAVKVWESRLRLLCCCLPQDESHRAAFSSISQLFSDFFSDTDLVPSDIAAGLALLHQEQDKMEPRLTTGAADYDIIGGDHLGCHFSSILQTTGLQYRDFIHVSFHNQIYQIPFFVALDHQKEAVVVAVRGTLSLKDVITDLSAECENLPIEGVSGACYAHKGMCQAADYIYKKLMNDGILNQAFSVVPEYKLVITGHSLGAGTAALLAILLHASFPTLQCYSFSPPGGLLSKALADYSKDFIVSVVLGKDLVPRLSIPNIEDLKRRILKIVSNCNKPKYRILLQGCWYELFGGDPDNFPTEMENRREEQLSRPLLGEESLMIRHSSSYQSLVSDDSPAHSAPHLPLFLPGRILHITEDGPSRRSCFSQVRYRADWSDEMVFRSILISPRMLTDHMPDAVLRALNNLSSEGPYSLCPSSLGNNSHNTV
uniref:Diacylglycerol lipase-beta n=1 Tax=Nothobranchius furzeri TaxID=105023 RepID=A0A8C6VXG1_NOTFU